MKKYISSILLLLAAMIWGFAFSAQKAAEALPPFTIGALRSAVAAVFLIVVILFLDKINHTGRHLFGKGRIIDINRTELFGGIICGAVLALASFFQQAGINAGTDAGKTSFITALYVVLVPIYALFLKKRAQIHIWISVAIAAVGFYFLCITGDFSIVPSDLIVLVCSLIFPIHILAIDSFSPRCDGVRMSFIQFVTATVLNTLFMLITEPIPSPVLIFENAIPILFLGIGSSGITYTLQIIGQKGADPAAASVILSLESVFGVIGSAIILGERMSEREYIGCAIVFVAVILSQTDIPAIIAKIKKNPDAKH